MSVSALNERSCRIICMWPHKNYFVRFFDGLFYTSFTLKIFIAAEMGRFFSVLNKPNAEIINETQKGKQFDHLRPEGTINMVDVVGAPIVPSRRYVCQQRGKNYNWLFLFLIINCK